MAGALSAKERLTLDSSLRLVLVATHLDADHIGGLIDVLTRYQVTDIWTSAKTTSTVTCQEVAIYMAAVGNTYGHPHPETIAALQSIGATIHGMDVNGTVTVTVGGMSYLISSQRKEHNRQLGRNPVGRQVW